MMMDDEETDRINPELIETLGIDDYPKRREYGRERGLNPNPTAAQIKEIDKLHQKLNAKVSSKAKKQLQSGEEEEEALNFDIKSKTRVISYEAPLLKRSKYLPPFTDAVLQMSIID